jgi:hypothetical protein
MKTPLKQVKSSAKKQVKSTSKTKEMKVSQTALEKKNTLDATKNENMRPPFKQKNKK